MTLNDGVGMIPADGNRPREQRQLTILPTSADHPADVS
jgi:hypothetical protein